MSQTLRQMRILAADMGITLAELIRRRASKTTLLACADDTGQVHMRPRVYCEPELLNWRFIPKTFTS